MTEPLASAPPQTSSMMPSRLAVLLGSVIAVGAACGDIRIGSGGGQPPEDCISPRGGTRFCGMPWDPDGDTISTATEQNLANRTDHAPVAGFYMFSTQRWDTNFSQARGQVDNGTLFRGMNITDLGVGYFHFNGCDGIDVDDWGTGHLLRLLEGTGRDWDSLRIDWRDRYDRNPARVQLGDMSLREGDYFATCGEPHDSHRNGLDADLRYIRKGDIDERPLNICDVTDAADYDTLTTEWLIYYLVEVNGDGQAGRPSVVTIFADTTCLGIPNTPDDPYIVHDANHKNHFHVRIRDPDGIN